MKKSTQNSEHYTWNKNCSGWHLVKSQDLSIIEELMPPETMEVKHYHELTQQFFYILKGIATFLVEDETIEVRAREGIHIKPMIKHQIKNLSNENLEFLVISQPTSRGDRIEVGLNNNAE